MLICKHMCLYECTYMYMCVCMYIGRFRHIIVLIQIYVYKLRNKFQVGTHISLLFLFPSTFSHASTLPFFPSPLPPSLTPPTSPPSLPPRAFQFPSDMHLEPEFWADTGRLDEVEQHQLDVTTNQLFTVAPKQGTLSPGETVSVLCSFK